jgi:hypothetical protein
VGPLYRFWVDASGTARLFHHRNAKNGSGDEASYYDIVLGDVDGAPLDFAIRQDFPADCHNLVEDLNETEFAIMIYGDGTSPVNTDVDGLAIGYLGSLEPTFVYLNRTGPPSAWSLGPDFVLRREPGSTVRAFTHDMSSSFLLYQPGMDPDFTPIQPRRWIRGRDVLFQTGDLVSAGIWAYDDERGTHPLVTYPGDTTQGASNVGTDGVDIVWTHGEGKEEGAFGLFPTVSIMTAPYTTDPEALQPRRLRTDMSIGIGTEDLQWAVGCGYAARHLATGRDVQVVRLSDGVAWVLAGNNLWGSSGGSVGA